MGVPDERLQVTGPPVHAMLTERPFIIPFADGVEKIFIRLIRLYRPTCPLIIPRSTANCLRALDKANIYSALAMTAAMI